MKSKGKRIVLSTGVEIPRRQVELLGHRRARTSSETICLTYSFKCDLGTREEYGGRVDCSLSPLTSRERGLYLCVFLMPENNMTKIIV